jgi:hypothetical protein
MKSTILNLIAAATLLVGWTAQAADEMAQNSKPDAVAATASAAATPATAENTQPPVKRTKSHKRSKAKHVHSHGLDLRHCLDLKTNIEIAQCAGES